MSKLCGVSDEQSMLDAFEEILNTCKLPANTDLTAWCDVVVKAQDQFTVTRLLACTSEELVLRLEIPGRGQS